MSPSPPLCHIQNHVLGILIRGHMASILSAVLVRWLHSLLERLLEIYLPDQSPRLQLMYCLCGRVPRRGMERIGWLMVNYSGRQSPSAEQASPTREGLNQGLQIWEWQEKHVSRLHSEHSSQWARLEKSTRTVVKAAVFVDSVQTTILKALEQFRKARPVLIVFPVCRYLLGPAPPSSFLFLLSSTHPILTLFFPHSCSLSSVPYALLYL